MHATDEPLDPPTEDLAAAEFDTEGHNLNSDFALGLARERAREDAKYAVDQARRREAKAVPKKGIRDRLTGK